jgi:hypothetical protein
VVFTCDRAGKYRSTGKDPALHSSKQRSNTGSKKCDCQMKVALRQDHLSKQWTLQVLKGAHNHSLSSAPTAYTAYRSAALTPEICAQISTLVSANSSTNQIMMTLRIDNPEITLITRDIGNFIQAKRVKELNGKTLIQWLLEVKSSPQFDSFY